MGVCRCVGMCGYVWVFGCVGVCGCGGVGVYRGLGGCLGVWGCGGAHCVGVWVSVGLV